MKKIACLFPGIGYTCDKPLLYYSQKLLWSLDWEIVPVRYSGFPSGVKGNPEKMEQSALMALEQTEDILGRIDWAGYSRILFIGKSVGTAVSCAYAARHRISCRQILFTPVEQTFRFAGSECIVFHGTSDPWADTRVIEQSCERLHIPLYETQGANHSLETGDMDTDIETMKSTMRIVRKYVEEYGQSS